MLIEPSLDDIYYSLEFQQYSLILDDESAYYYARDDLLERRRDDLQMMPHKLYLQTPEWGLTAAAAKERAGFRCMLCNSSGELHAHHRTYERLGDEHPDDVIAICAACHRRHHGIV